MFEYLYALPDTYLFVLISVFSLIISVSIILVIKVFVKLTVHYDDNPVLGNISQLIGIIYGVLAGLMALYLINNITATGDAIQHEANAIANIYRDSKWLTEPTRSTIQSELKTYINKVVQVEWPLMQEGKDLQNDGEFIIENITDQLVNYKAAKNADSLLVHDTVDEIKTLYDAREQRIQKSFTSLNGEIWVVILIGTILTIGINYLFKMNFYLHLVSVSAATLMASSMMFLLVALDRPFQGEFGIEPKPFISVLQFMEKAGQTHTKH